VGLVAMTVTGLIVRLPNGEYDMGGLGAIALAGLAGTLVSSAILGSALLRKPRRN
jgi:hypothetical protein